MFSQIISSKIECKTLIPLSTSVCQFYIINTVSVGEKILNTFN